MFTLIETDSVSSKGWLEANQDIKINVFIENLVPTLNMPGGAIMKDEFQDWDSLSDEALLNFEQNLI